MYTDATGQAVFGGDDDYLVGVVNNTTNPISQVNLDSTAGLLNFDGDGLDQYGIIPNSFDVTGDGGNNVYFTNITGDGTGAVKLFNPVSPGGNSYFALEENLNQNHTCAEVINNTVAPRLTGNYQDAAGNTQPTAIYAIFQPNFGIGLDEAAKDCGVQSFDWEQKITNLPLPSRLLPEMIQMYH